MTLLAKRSPAGCYLALSFCQYLLVWLDHGRRSSCCIGGQPTEAFTIGKCGFNPMVSLSWLGKGTDNEDRLLLTEAAVSMGAVAIWATHYIGERALVMANDAEHHQVVHRPSLTVASFFWSFFMAGASFYSFSFAKGFRWPQNVLGGLLMGTTVSGTFYLDQYGVINYSYVNSERHVIGAVLIAILASTAALSFTPHTTMTLTNTWSKRFACTLLLAAAVSGMHWVAAAGTKYEYKRTFKIIGLSNVAIVIAVACLVSFVRRMKYQTSLTLSRVLVAA